MKNKVFLPLTISIAALLVGATVTANVLCYGRFDPLLRVFLGTSPDSTAQIDGVDSQYNKPICDSVESLVDASRDLVRQIASEGITLIKNEDQVLPLAKNTTVSLFSISSVDFVYGGSGSGASSVELSTPLKEGLEASGLKVNESLYNFYAKGAGASYRRGEGVINFGWGGEDWSKNECPIDLITADSGLVKSFEGTTPIYIFSRTGGEGGDLARDMEGYKGKKGEHYLEPSEQELGVLSYLNDHFSNVIVLLNCNNAFELDWVSRFPNVKSILHVPGLGRTGTLGLGEVLVGQSLKGEQISPSGHLVDTYVFDNFSAPATQNFGDFAYQDSEYYYVAYNEGIYVGYRYYETRYFDKMMGASNVGDFDYDKVVAYPFGHGESYTTFSRSAATYSLNGDQLIAKQTITNTGSHYGSDVVQAYISKPYTNYDKENGIEQAAVELVGFAKTKNLAPSESVEVEIAIDLERMKTFDEKGAGTYIVEPDDYHFVLAPNAHEATKAVLAQKGVGMSALNTYVSHPLSFDDETYSVDSKTGKAIEKQFGHGVYDGQTFLSRSNWSVMDNNGLMYGSESGVASASNASQKQIQTPLSASEKAKLDSLDSLNPNPDHQEVEAIQTDSDCYVTNLRGLKVTDDEFRKAISKLSGDEIGTIITKSGYQIPGADSISMPQSVTDDGPAGLNILPDHDSALLPKDNRCMSWPTELAIASSWNVKLAEKMGDLIADEGVYAHVAGWYGPAMNIHRTPFSGRNFEYYSEDPFLSGVLGQAAAAAAGRNGLLPFIKHFALNDQETHRDRNGLITYANEQSIREIYLLPFEISVKAPEEEVISYKKNGDVYQKTITKLNPVRGVMTSYNRIGSVWAGGNYNLITNVLRGEWGYEGMVLTDWNVNGYMDVYQMLEAGGDAKLDTVGASLSVVRDVQKSIHCNRAMVNVLYAVANSNSVNGFAPDMKIVHGRVNYHLMLMGLDIAVGLALCGIGVAYFLHFRKKKDN